MRMPFASVALSALVVASVATAVVPAHATVVVVPPLEDMALQSDVIAEVVVGDARVVKEGGRVVTYTTLEVKDAWKGAKTGDKVELFQLGGDLDGKSSWITGALRFQKGERLVFFGMRSKTRPAVIPYGIGFGVFEVKPELTGDAVTELVGDVVQVGTDGAPAVRKYESLASFKQLVLRANQLHEIPQMGPLKKKLLPKQQGR